jgi:hypothetical protein
MEPDLETVIRQALEDARASGKDYVRHTAEAVRSVHQRPIMPMQKRHEEQDVHLSRDREAIGPMARSLGFLRCTAF